MMHLGVGDRSWSCKSQCRILASNGLQKRVLQPWRLPQGLSPEEIHATEFAPHIAVQRQPLMPAHSHMHTRQSAAWVHGI